MHFGIIFGGMAAIVLAVAYSSVSSVSTAAHALAEFFKSNPLLTLGMAQATSAMFGIFVNALSSLYSMVSLYFIRTYVIEGSHPKYCGMEDYIYAHAWVVSGTYMVDTDAGSSKYLVTDQAHLLLLNGTPAVFTKCSTTLDRSRTRIHIKLTVPVCFGHIVETLLESMLESMRTSCRIWRRLGPKRLGMIAWAFRTTAAFYCMGHPAQEKPPWSNYWL